MGNASDTSDIFLSKISKEHDILVGSIYSVFCKWAACPSPPGRFLSPTDPSSVLPCPRAGFLSLAGNCILLLVAYHKRSMLKPAEFFIVNLSVSDLGMTLTLFPLAIPSSFSHRCVSLCEEHSVAVTRHTSVFSSSVNRWLFGEITCQLYAMCGVLFGLCSLTNLTALSLVCCLKVCFPNHGEAQKRPPEANRNSRSRRPRDPS